MHYDADVNVPADAKAVIVVAVDRRRPLRPAHPGLRRAARSWPTAPTSQTDRHRGAARARPDLLQPRRAQRRARPQRRQQERRARPTCSRPPPRTSAARARSSTRPSRTSARSARPSTTTRRSCSAPPASSRASSAPWPPTTRPCGSSTSRSPTSPTCSPARRRSWPRRCTTSSIGLGDVATFVQENRDILGKNINAHQPGRQGAGQAARARSTRPSTRRTGGAQQPGADLQPAGRHPRHQRQPRRARSTRSPPTRRRCSAASSARPTRAASCATSASSVAQAARAPFGTGSSYGQQFDPTLGGLVAVDQVSRR